MNIDPEDSPLAVLAVDAKTIDMRGRVNTHGEAEATLCVLKKLFLSADDVSLSGCFGAENLTVTVPAQSE